MAIKVEPASSSNRQLEGEFKIMRVLKDGVGIPRALYFEKQKESNVMVMDLLGPSLEDLFSYCKNRFSLKTVCMLAEEMILRIEYMHKMGFIHRDIKPDNFAVGLNENANVIYLIDFGLSKSYHAPPKGRHIPYPSLVGVTGGYRENKNLTGTPRYASLANHIGIEQSRRDDLESLGLILMYFLKGKLPWQGLRAGTKEEKYARIMEYKIEVVAVCAGEG